MLDMLSLKLLFTKFKQFIAKTRSMRYNFNYVVFGACVLALVWVWSGPGAGPAHVPRHLRKFLRFPEGYTVPEKQLNETELRQLTLKVEQMNAHIEVFNWEKYLPVNTETTIIVILVHKDVERLQYLIISLGQVRDIHKVLLIFSHSYYDDIINALVKSIDFCKVMQIFYPFSLQLFPNKFPGIDPDDCNVTSRPETPRSPAPGEEPCFERDARRTQRKQHWWWTANFVFEALEWSSAEQVTVFLEEDSYVLPDLLHMLQYARRVLAYFPSVEVLSLGRPHAQDLDFDLLTIDAWSPPYDRGLAFNKTTWAKISENASLYCFYDDCSWSYSLLHLFGSFTDGVVEMAASVAPRVLSTGVFASGARAARWAWRTARRAALFPAEVRATLTVGDRGRVRRPWCAPPRGNGGWADLRDQMLCLDPLVTTTAETATETSQPFKREIVNVSHSI